MLQRVIRRGKQLSERLRLHRNTILRLSELMIAQLRRERGNLNRQCASAMIWSTTAFSSKAASPRVSVAAFRMLDKLELQIAQGRFQPCCLL